MKEIKCERCGKILHEEGTSWDYNKLIGIIHHYEGHIFEINLKKVLGKGKFLSADEQKQKEKELESMDKSELLGKFGLNQMTNTSKIKRIKDNIIKELDAEGWDAKDINLFLREVLE